MLAGMDGSMERWMDLVVYESQAHTIHPDTYEYGMYIKYPCTTSTTSILRTPVSPVWDGMGWMCGCQSMKCSSPVCTADTYSKDGK